MNTCGDRSSHGLPSPESLEAAAWIMRLNSHEPTPVVKAAFREWLAQRSEHHASFELGADIWEKAATLPIPRAARLNFSSENPWWRPLSKMATTCAVLACFAAIGVLAYRFRSPELATTTGQELTQTLEDGTRVTLNTQTRLHVKFDRQTRLVTLDFGEALFDVAKNPGRAFIVRAGNHEITALGTQFVIRYDEQHAEVTLVEGRVQVTGPMTNLHEPPFTHALNTVLHPGDRLTFNTQAPPRQDRPQVDQVLAWRHGQIAFDNTPLAEAIEEMNRYGIRKLALGQSDIGGVLISGLFRTGDSDNFALALTQTHPLQVRELHGQLLIEASSR